MSFQYIACFDKILYTQGDINIIINFVRTLLLKYLNKGNIFISPNSLLKFKSLLFPK